MNPGHFTFNPSKLQVHYSYKLIYSMYVCILLLFTFRKVRFVKCLSLVEECSYVECVWVLNWLFSYIFIIITNDLAITSCYFFSDSWITCHNKDYALCIHD